jgi:hypothetical protein
VCIWELCSVSFVHLGDEFRTFCKWILSRLKIWELNPCSVHPPWLFRFEVLWRTQGCCGARQTTRFSITGIICLGSRLGSFSSPSHLIHLGGFHGDAVELLQRLQGVVSQAAWAHEDMAWYSMVRRVGFTIALAVGRQLATRLPGWGPCG